MQVQKVLGAGVESCGYVANKVSPKVIDTGSLDSFTSGITPTVNKSRIGIIPAAKFVLAGVFALAAPLTGKFAAKAQDVTVPVASKATKVQDSIAATQKAVQADKPISIKLYDVNGYETLTYPNVEAAHIRCSYLFYKEKTEGITEWETMELEELAEILVNIFK